MTHSFPTRRSSDLGTPARRTHHVRAAAVDGVAGDAFADPAGRRAGVAALGDGGAGAAGGADRAGRSEEHTSELQSLMRISYAVFCLKKNKKGSQDQA